MCWSVGSHRLHVQFFRQFSMWKNAFSLFSNVFLFLFENLLEIRKVQIWSNFSYKKSTERRFDLISQNQIKNVTSSNLFNAHLCRTQKISWIWYLIFDNSKTLSEESRKLVKISYLLWSSLNLSEIIITPFLGASTTLYNVYSRVVRKTKIHVVSFICLKNENNDFVFSGWRKANQHF